MKIIKILSHFFLHRNPNHLTQYLNFLLGRNFNGDINLYFTYDTQYKQWFTTGTALFYRKMAKIINESSFDLLKIIKKILFSRKKRKRLCNWFKRSKTKIRT